MCPKNRSSLKFWVTSKPKRCGHDERVESGYLCLDCWSSSWQFLTILVDWQCFFSPLWHPAQPQQGPSIPGPITTWDPGASHYLWSTVRLQMYLQIHCTLQNQRPQRYLPCPLSPLSSNMLFVCAEGYSLRAWWEDVAGRNVTGKQSRSRTQLMLVNNEKSGASASVGSNAE